VCVVCVWCCVCVCGVCVWCVCVCVCVCGVCACVRACASKCLWEESRRNGSEKLILRFVVLPNIITVFFANLMHKFFILIHLLHSCTFFEHYCTHLREDNCTNTIVLLKMSTIVLETCTGM